MSAYVTQSDLEQQFGAERVAQAFSVIQPDGSSTGTADASALAYGIRMGSAEFDRVVLGVYGDSMPFADPVPDTVKQIVGIFVMHGAMLRRPEYAGDPKKSPYFSDYTTARADLEAIRKAQQRIAANIAPANVGGEIANSLPVSQQPFFFVPDPTTGRGGFGSGGY